jgi:signal peptidase II
LTNNRKKLAWFGIIALIVIILDQWSKFVVRTTPELHRTVLIEGWLKFNFTKNPGMAMGITWADTWVISLVSIIATIVIVTVTMRALSRANLGFMICMGLIIGGAIGNIIDRFTMAKVGGYGGLLDGHVVDFIHFYLRIGNWDVFPYIFNVADMAISTSIVVLLIFSKWLIPPDKPLKKAAPDEQSEFDEPTSEAPNPTT